MTPAREEEFRAEQLLLAAAALDGRAVGSLDGVSESDYSHPSHAILHRALKLLAARHPELIRARVRVDRPRLETILAELDSDPRALTAALESGVPSVSQCEHYASVVRRGGALRRSAEAAREFVRAYESGVSETAEIERLAQSLAHESGGAANASDWTTGLELAQMVARDFERALERRGAIAGLSTGFDLLDDITDGFLPGQVWVLAGRPGTGKSALALQFALSVLRGPKLPVAMVSLEMPDVETGQRGISQMTSVDSYAIRRANLTESELMKFSKGLGQLGELPISLLKGSNLSVDQIRSRVRRLHWQWPIGLLVVDYLQLVTPTTTGRQRNREAEVAEVSRGLKSFGMELNIPVLILSQLNRDATQREPKVSDLRESGAIEQDADKILLLHRPKEDDPKVTLIVGKNRNGRAGSRVPLVLDGPHSRFEVERT